MEWRTFRSVSRTTNANSPISPARRQPLSCNAALSRDFVGRNRIPQPPILQPGRPQPSHPPPPLRPNLTPLESTLTNLYENKPLTSPATPLESTLTQNTGEDTPRARATGVQHRPRIQTNFPRGRLPEDCGNPHWKCALHQRTDAVSFPPALFPPFLRRSATGPECSPSLAAKYLPALHALPSPGSPRQCAPAIR